MDFKAAAAKEAQQLINDNEERRVALLKDSLEVHRHASLRYRELFMTAENKLHQSQTTAHPKLSLIHI